MIDEKKLPLLPASWLRTSLGAIGSVVSGGTPSTKDEHNFGGDIAWITPADLSGFKGKFISKGKRNITIKGLKSSSATIVPRGSVLFSSRAPIGYVALAANPITTNQGFKNIVLHECIFNEFVYYYLQTIKNLAESYASGTTFLEISAFKFAQLPMPLAPLPEQHRIVEIIEELFTKLDAGVDALKKIKAQLKRYRQAVLKYAFEGKLTEINNTETLRLVKSSTIFSFITSGSRGWAKYYASSGPLFIRITNLQRESINLKLVDKKRVDLPDCVEGLRTKVQQNDILVSITADIGTVAIIPNGFEDAYINQHIALIRPVEGSCSKYLAWFLTSEKAQKQFQQMERGATKKGLGLDDIRNLNIPLPPLKEQEQIVEVIELRFSIADGIEQVIEQSLKQSERLRQSILKAAFEGKLVPQDPSDEPAGKLLERIKAEKAQQSNKVPFNKKRSSKQKESI